MSLTFNDFLQLVKVIRMLYGVDISREFFEFYYHKWGFKFTIKDGKLEIPTENN